MQTRSHEPDLEQAVSEVLGMMFFSDVLGKQSCEVALDPSNEQVGVRVEFRGEESSGADGEMRVVMPSETASALAANFLGLDLTNAAGEALTSQVLGELGNMLCGAYLSRAHGEQIFKLSPPERMPASAPVDHCYELDSGAIGLALEWHNKDSDPPGPANPAD